MATLRLPVRTAKVLYAARCVHLKTPAVTHFVRTCRLARSFSLTSGSKCEGHRLHPEGGTSESESENLENDSWEKPLPKQDHKHGRNEEAFQLRNFDKIMFHSLSKQGDDRLRYWDEITAYSAKTFGLAWWPSECLFILGGASMRKRKGVGVGFRARLGEMFSDEEFEVRTQETAEELMRYIRDKEPFKAKADHRCVQLVYLSVLARAPENREKVMRAVEDIVKAYPYPYYDAITAEILLAIYTKTLQYEAALDVTEKAKFLDKDSNFNKALVHICLDTGRYDLAAHYLKNYWWKTRNPVWLISANLPLRKMAAAIQSSHVFLDSFLIEGSKAVKFLLNEETANLICDFSQNLKEPAWTISKVKARRGRCPSCEEALKPRTTLTASECEELKEAFYLKCVAKDNIHKTTTKTEWRAFLQFLDDHPPFDIVIDGLNLVSSTRQRVKKGLKQSRSVDVLKYFKEMKGMRVLVIFRSRLDEKELKTAMKYSTLYFTSHESLDDVFSIYAALNSGPGTYILSEDEFSDHKILLDHDMHKLFVRWQNACQAYLAAFIYSPDGRVEQQVKWPLTVWTGLQQNRKGWHIPIEEKFPHGRGFRFSRQMLCCIRNTKE